MVHFSPHISVLEQVVTWWHGRPRKIIKLHTLRKKYIYRNTPATCYRLYHILKTNLKKTHFFQPDQTGWGLEISLMANHSSLFNER